LLNDLNLQGIMSITVMSFTKNKLILGAIILLAFHMISCTPLKEVVYFYDLKDSTSKNLGAMAKNLHTAQMNFENPIQKNDQLWITVGGSNLLDLVTVNSAAGTGAAVGGELPVISRGAIGFLVEADGFINMPYVGKVQAAGLSRLQLEDSLTTLFKDYTKNPVVNVRFLNYRFWVLGEVSNEGRYTMTTERTTILEAISMAGDLTKLGKRENVLVTRDENGVRKFGRVDLTSSKIFTSPYYYLKTNDIIYVEPVKSAFGNRKGIPFYLTIASVAISLIVTIISISKL
jgi:polysaccharide export outer membrane protein